MNINRVKWTIVHLRSDETTTRKGAFLILSAFALMSCLVFVSLSVDIGFLSLTKQRMQNGVDAAALAAAQEITTAVNTAPQGVQDITLYALAQSRIVASEVAELNGVFVDPNIDVIFGKRSFNAATQTFEVEWDATPANVVKVVSRRDQSDPSAPDGKLRLFFSGVTGDRFATVRAEAIAYVESRDIVVVHDFSRSMNFDSYYNNESGSRLSDGQIEQNLQMVWNDMQMPNIGSLTYEPQFLSLTNSQNGASATATFKYDSLEATSSGNIQKVVLRYDNNSTQTFSGLSGGSVNVNGTRNISTAWVTVQPSLANQAFTTSNNGFTVTFSANRKSVSFSSSYSRIRNIIVGFSDNSTYSYNYGTSSRAPYSSSYSGSKNISYIRIRRQNNSTYYRFDVEEFGDPEEIQFDDTNWNVRQAFGLTGSYPYASGSWDSFINHARNYSEFSSRGYREKYGGLTLMNYILREQSGYWQTRDIWKTRHYPFHAIKEGHMMLCDFLEDLGFDDHVGMVSYDTNHRQEKILDDNNPAMPYVNISSEPITDNYEAVRNLMRYKQAAHYSYATNMGGGLQDAIDMLLEHSRTGARRTILLMTDGNTNTIDSGANTSLPWDWNWNELFDYDGDGQADYTTNSTQRRYVLRLANEAIANGMTIHTMSVGVDADRDLMRAIAHLAGGHYIDVPGGSSVLDMEAEVEEAFHRIASFVPPAKLMQDQ